MISLEGLRTACLSGSGPRVIDAAEAYEGAWREEHARFAKLLAAHRSPPSSSHYARRKQRVATRALDDDVRQQLRSALSSRDARRRATARLVQDMNRALCIAPPGDALRYATLFARGALRSEQ
jgi:hypothetical protein